MLIKKLITCSLFTAFLIIGCKIQKATLDPITIHGNSPRANVYRASYPKLTDILHTKLDLSFNWDSAFVIGNATIEAKPYFYSADKVVLNAQGFKINSVSLIKKDEKAPLKYTYDGHLLTVHLDKTYPKSQKFTLFIEYVAMPYKLKVGKDIVSEDHRGIYFINRDGKNPDKPKQIWTQGETEHNSNWFPTINGPQEKMTQEISLTVSNKFKTLSNGILDFSSDNGDGTRTDSWRQEQPHSTYLTMIAVGDFTIVKDKWNDKEVSYYMEHAFAKNAKLIFGKTSEMLSFFSKKTGVEYPWEKYSQIVVRDYFGGAMENTTATLFFEGMNMSEGQYLDENYEDIIAHELFHHWFGNLATTESWANLTLNEGFATYGEYLWNEYKYGKDFADYTLYKDRNIYFSSDVNKQLDVIRYDYANREQMFDAVTYQKGALIIHMLRKTVGDEAFFSALKLYLTKFAFKTAEIHDLRQAFEETTGQDLNWFFNQWFLASGHPILQIQTIYNTAQKQAVITVQQKQNLNESPLYRLPIAIDIYTKDKVERKEILVSKQSETFTFPVKEAPLLINVDAEKYILAEKSEQKTIAQYIYQYENAPLFMDRYEAIEKLKLLKDDKAAHTTIIIKALDDKNWFIRQQAVNFIPNLNETEKAGVYEKIKQMALSDERSYVRASAITILTKVYSNRPNKPIFEDAKKDKASSVQKALLTAVSN